MAGLDIKISGLDAVKKKLDPRKLDAGIQKALNSFGFRFQEDAINFAPTDEARLKSSIFFIPGTNLSIKVGASANYAAYIEFGTGPYAASYVPALPKEWRDYARKFFVNGQGTTPAHPFVYPAINKNDERLRKDLQKALND